MFEYTGSGQIVPKDVVSVRFHPSVVEVEERAFKNCTLAMFNDGLKKIGSNAFEGCKALQYIDLPSSLLEIGSGAFRFCSNLKRVELNEGYR